MSVLEKLLGQFAIGTNARWWVGETPQGRGGDIAHAIAEFIDYPAAESEPFENDGLVLLDPEQAAHVLAVAGTISLAHGNCSPSEHSLQDARDVLSQLRRDAIFLSNGLWGLQGSTSWSPLTAATFDCGVIGYDASTAFIFWVEEDD